MTRSYLYSVKKHYLELLFICMSIHFCHFIFAIIKLFSLLVLVFACLPLWSYASSPLWQSGLFGSLVINTPKPSCTRSPTFYQSAINKQLGKSELLSDLNKKLRVNELGVATTRFYHICLLVRVTQNILTPPPPKFPGTRVSKYSSDACQFLFLPTSTTYKEILLVD